MHHNYCHYMITVQCTRCGQICVCSGAYWRWETFRSRYSLKWPKSLTDNYCSYRSRLVLDHIYLTLWVSFLMFTSKCSRQLTFFPVLSLLFMLITKNEFFEFNSYSIWIGELCRDTFPEVEHWIQRKYSHAISASNTVSGSQTSNIHVSSYLYRLKLNRGLVCQLTTLY